MQTKAKRGRPPKARDRVKAEYLDIRLGSAEKATFKDAAKLAGLDLSSWVREHLRAVARNELEAAGKPVAFLASQTNSHQNIDRLLSVRYERPSKLRLQFADKSFTLALKRLGMPVDKIRWSTVAVTKTGDAMTVMGMKDDLIPIDSSTLRYLVDESYAAKTESALKSLQFSRDELRELARDNPPPRDWFEQPERDLTRKSWK